jgi:hypothetical protein
MGSGALVVALLLTGPIVTFEWAVPDGAVAPDFYEVELAQEDMEPEVFATVEPSISLSPERGKGFELRVRACAAQGCSEWSDVSQPLSLNQSADFSGDGVVGVPDYKRFGQLMSSQGLEADLNGDTVVGVPDFAEFAEHFNACVGKVGIGGEDIPAYVKCREEGAGE